jgi:hypothetical protein
MAIHRGIGLPAVDGCGDGDFQINSSKPRLLRRAQLNGVSQGGEHPLCQVAIGGEVQTPLANQIDFAPWS